MNNDKETCLRLINSAFLKAYLSSKLLNFTYNSRSNENRIYYSYTDENELLRKRTTYCFNKYPKIVEQNRQFLQQCLDESYPGIVINVAFNKTDHLVGGDTDWAFITTSISK